MRRIFGATHVIKHYRSRRSPMTWYNRARVRRPNDTFHFFQKTEFIIDGHYTAHLLKFRVAATGTLSRSRKISKGDAARFEFILVRL